MASQEFNHRLVETIFLFSVLLLSAFFNVDFLGVFTGVALCLALCGILAVKAFRVKLLSLALLSEAGKLASHFGIRMEKTPEVSLPVGSLSGAHRSPVRRLARSRCGLHCLLGGHLQ